MSIELKPIVSKDLTSMERESILAHAIDLHLVGSDDADSAGFDIVEKGSPDVHLLRSVEQGKTVGVTYLLPVPGTSDKLEMTILIFPEFRGKHYTAPMVDAIEGFMRAGKLQRGTLCAAVHDHNPMRKELTEFLLRHGYAYSSELRMFMKRVV
jgi:hypothetical protein